MITFRVQGDPGFCIVYFVWLLCGSAFLVSSSKALYVALYHYPHPQMSLVLYACVPILITSASASDFSGGLWIHRSALCSFNCESLIVLLKRILQPVISNVRCSHPTWRSNPFISIPSIHGATSVFEVLLALQGALNLTWWSIQSNPTTHGAASILVVI